MARHFALVLLLLAPVSWASHYDDEYHGVTKRVRLFGMDPKAAKRCKNWCPPVVLASACGSDNPDCLTSNEAPPDCGEAVPRSMSRTLTLTLTELRWICAAAESDRPVVQIGRSVFRYPKGTLVISYLGGGSDARADDFLEYVAKSVRAN
jgi:hypothetical protein